MNHKKRILAGIATLVLGMLLITVAHDQAKHDAEHDENKAHAPHAAPRAKKPSVITADHDHDAEEGEEKGIHLTPEQHQRFGIVLSTAGAGAIRSQLRLSGEVSFNEDSLSHLSPRVSGIVREVHKTVGDFVKAGEVLAVIDSRELADAKSEYLAAKARAALAEKTLLRERTLRDQKVTSEQDLLDVEQAFAESRIMLRALQQKLYALGLSEKAAASLNQQHGKAMTRYEICAPIGGVVVSKQITPGESLEADADIFTIVDTSTVWINLTVYTRHLRFVNKDDEVRLSSDHDDIEQNGRVAMVTPFVDQTTRSATARVVLDNTHGNWIPGTFVSGLITASVDELPVVVPRRAVQNIDGHDVVFVEHTGGFEVTEVLLGEADSESVEIKSGLIAGTRYVAEGAFELKSTIVTSALDAHAGHGH